MATIPCRDRSELPAAMEALQAGDCLELASFSALAGSVRELLTAAEQIEARRAELVCRSEGLDTRSEQGRLFFPLCRALRELDGRDRREKQRSGIEKAREEGKYRGRKPIAVDEGLFERVVQRWRNGEISARQAMSQLDLKPNTFYRRIKEQEDLKMKDYKKAEQEIKAELREATKQSRRELEELKKQVREEAREVKKTVDEKLDLHSVEKELRRDRHRAESEHRDAVREMEKTVEAETREHKQMLETRE